MQQQDRDLSTHIEVSVHLTDLDSSVISTECDERGDGGGTA